MISLTLEVSSFSDFLVTWNSCLLSSHHLAMIDFSSDYFPCDRAIFFPALSHAVVVREIGFQIDPSLTEIALREIYFQTGATSWPSFVGLEISRASNLDSSFFLVKCCPFLNDQEFSSEAHPGKMILGLVDFA